MQWDRINWVLLYFGAQQCYLGVKGGSDEDFREVNEATWDSNEVTSLPDEVTWGLDEVTRRLDEGKWVK